MPSTYFSTATRREMHREERDRRMREAFNGTPNQGGTIRAESPPTLEDSQTVRVPTWDQPGAATMTMSDLERAMGRISAPAVNRIQFEGDSSLLAEVERCYNILRELPAPSDRTKEQVDNLVISLTEEVATVSQNFRPINTEPNNLWI